MSEEQRNRGDDSEQPDAQSDSEPRRAMETYGRGVRTALRNNATAYGFSISITASYGLVTGARGTASAVETISFAAGAAVAFLLVGSLFVAIFPLGSLGEGGQVATIGGVVDLLAVSAAVSTAFGLSRIADFIAWPLTGLGTVMAYLLVGGLDILIARTAARHTYIGRSQ